METGIEARAVHHPEHQRQSAALAFFIGRGTQQPAVATILFPVRHDTGGIAPEAHLVFNTYTFQVIGLTQASVIINPDLGDSKQGNPGCSGKRSLYPRQGAVNDVLGYILFPSGYKTFSFLFYKDPAFQWGMLWW